MAHDFSKRETQKLFVVEVRKRMEAPFFMSRDQAEMLVAALMTEPPAPPPQRSEGALTGDATPSRPHHPGEQS